MGTCATVGLVRICWNSLETQDMADTVAYCTLGWSDKAKHFLRFSKTGQLLQIRNIFIGSNSWVWTRARGKVFIFKKKKICKYLPFTSKNIEKENLKKKNLNFVYSRHPKGERLFWPGQKKPKLCFEFPLIFSFSKSRTQAPSIAPPYWTMLTMLVTLLSFSCSRSISQLYFSSCRS